MPSPRRPTQRDGDGQLNLRRPSRTGATVNKVTAVRRALAVINNLVPLQLSRRSGESEQLEAIGIFCGMDDLDRRKKEALVLHDA